MEEPHLDSKSSIARLDDVAKTVHLDVCTIMAEEIKDPVFGTVRSWRRKGIQPEAKSPKIQQSSGLFSFCQEFDRLLIEEEGQLLCYNDPFAELEDENLPICLTLLNFSSLFSTWPLQRNGWTYGRFKYVQ